MFHFLKSLAGLLLIGLFVSACTAPPKFSRISVGFTKPQVIAALGEPKRTSADGRAERLSCEWMIRPTGVFMENGRTFSLSMGELLLTASMTPPAPATIWAVLSLPTLRALSGSNQSTHITLVRRRFVRQSM